VACGDYPRDGLLLHIVPGETKRVGIYRAEAITGDVLLVGPDLDQQTARGLMPGLASNSNQIFDATHDRLDE